MEKSERSRSEEQQRLRYRNLLRRLVQAETPAPQDKAVLRKLERKEILEKTESGYGFQVPLVENYVEQAVEEEE